MGNVHDRLAASLRRLVGGRVAEQAAPLPAGADAAAAARRAEVPPELVARAVAETVGLEYRDSLAGTPVSSAFVGSVPIAYARRHGVVGLAGANGEVTVAFSEPDRWEQVQVLAKVLGKRVIPVLAPRREILKTVNAAYQQRTGQAQQVLEQISAGGGDGAREVLAELAAGGNEDLLDVAGRRPVIRLVNLMIFEAVKRGASDVHVQGYRDRLLVRFRVDGMLFDVYQPPKAIQAEVISRIKVMGGMNIAEQRLAQDGRATVEVGDRVVDLRISTLPTSFGERAVIRLLDKSARLYELGELGMPPGVLARFRELIRRDHGIILVTGPTGSGKTTTLYAALGEINSKQLNILTLEDPIEYGLEGISQTQVSTRKGMTFADGLRHVLRQDPDIIMVGEIRDAETARMAIQSALTGHLVFSTLHTNDAAGAVARMLDLGVEPYLLASSLLGAMAQRLVRRVCVHCRRPHVPDEAELAKLGLARKDLAGRELFRAAGCQACMDSGYSGRVGVFELLTVDEPIREAVLARGKASSIRALAASNGMAGLRSAGLARALDGTTTMAEVDRVAGREDA